MLTGNNDKRLINALQLIDKLITEEIISHACMYISRHDDPTNLMGLQQNLLPDLPDYDTAVNDPRYAKVVNHHYYYEVLLLPR